MKTIFYRVIAYGCGMGDPGTTLRNFALRSEAESFAIGKGDWGGDASVCVVHAIVVDGKTYELASPEPVAVQQPVAEVY